MIKIVNNLKTKKLSVVGAPFSKGFNDSWMQTLEPPEGEGPWDGECWVTTNEFTDDAINMLKFYFPNNPIDYQEV